MKSNVRRELKFAIPLLILIMIAAVVFWDFPAMYFQQDEWHSFGFIVSEGIRYITLDHSPLQLLVSDRIGARAIMYGLFTRFGLVSQWYAAIAFLFHLVNTYLVYVLASFLFKNKTGARIAALLFLVNSVSHQAFTWFGTMAGSTPSVTFLLLSVLAYLKFLQEDNWRAKYLSLFFLWLSFLFKETGLFLFVLYPLWYLLLKRGKMGKTVREHLPFIAYGVLIAILRMSEIFAPAGETNVLITSRSGLGGIIGNLFLYPVSAISQLFIPSQVMYTWTERIVAIVFPAIEPGTTAFDLASQVTVGNALSVLLSIALLLFIGIILKKEKKGKTGKMAKREIVIGSLLFLVLSFLPYVFIRKGEAFLEPRYYYAGAAGAAIVAGSIIEGFLASKKRFVALASVFIVCLFVLTHASIIRDDLRFQKQVGEERRSIINTIVRRVPVLPPKVIFYVIGDTSYYGLGELTIPFQSGLGQVLLLTYSLKGQIDPIFFREGSFMQTQDRGFLYDTIDQGYKEVAGRGFGYFWDKTTLADAVRQYRVDPNNIFSFYYRGQTHELVASP